MQRLAVRGAVSQPDHRRLSAASASKTDSRRQTGAVIPIGDLADQAEPADCEPDQHPHHGLL